MTSNLPAIGNVIAPEAALSFSTPYPF